MTSARQSGHGEAHGKAHREGRGERGSSSVEAVLLFPVLLFVVLIAIQADLYAHARHVARAGAREGVQAARHYDGSTTAANTRARHYLQLLGGRVLTVRSVHATRTATQASVTVVGDVRGVLPWPKIAIRETSTAPVERFVPTQEQP